MHVVNHMAWQPMGEASYYIGSDQPKSEFMGEGNEEYVEGLGMVFFRHIRFYQPIMIKFLSWSSCLSATIICH